jgi:hypothetical protein
MHMHVTRALAIPAAFGALISLGACSAATQRTTTVESGGDVTGNVVPVTPVDNRTIPIGATVVTTLDQALGTEMSKAGDTFTATVSNTLYAQDGSVVVPAGAKIDGRVTALDDSDNATEPNLIRLDFNRIRMNGRSYPFAASIVQSNPTQTSSSTSADKTRRIIIGGAVGAALGGLISGGDVDKIVIGGAIGAAAGSIVSLGTEVNATLPAGSQMTLRATQTTMLR